MGPGFWEGIVDDTIWEEGAIVRRAVLVLEAAASQPLTPRLVQEVLGITPAERARWAKDGRLPVSATAFVRCANMVTIPSYAASAIAELADNPDVIAGWRHSDAEISQ